jgi:hypothetical protein
MRKLFKKNFNLKKELKEIFDRLLPVISLLLGNSPLQHWCQENVYDQTS